MRLLGLTSLYDSHMALTTAMAVVLFSAEKHIVPKSGKFCCALRIGWKSNSCRGITSNWHTPQTFLLHVSPLYQAPGEYWATANGDSHKAGWRRTSPIV